MAIAYTDLYALYDNGDLRKKVEVALLIKAQALLDAPTPSAQQRAWARHVFEQPASEALLVLKYLLAKNVGAANVGVITGASDATIQSNVDGVVAQFVTAYSGA